MKINSKCPLCSSIHYEYAFTQNNIRIIKCKNCSLLKNILFHNNQEINYSFNKSSLNFIKAVESCNKNFILITNKLSKKSFLSFKSKHFSINAIDYSQLKKLTFIDKNIIFDDTILDLENPISYLRAIREKISSHKVLIFFVIELINHTHRFDRDSLVLRKYPSRYWATWNSFFKILKASGFENISIDNISDIKNGAESSLISCAPKKVIRKKFLLSVIIPVFNEFETFPLLIQKVINKKLTNFEIEIIIIESNSSDGTRGLVKKYQNTRNIQVIFQDKPRGKGYAVAEGLKKAKGDIVLIQDADLEYDIDDYEILLEEISSFRSIFVLGSRHSGSWKIRKFIDMPFLTHVYNLAHVFFVRYINFLIGSKFVDPFTMYKIFYRDCVYGLNLKYRRFDFDHELVIKLYRRGFIPIEIPVNYYARSFTEGKKVSIFKDGLTWLYKDIFLAYENIDYPIVKGKR